MRCALNMRRVYTFPSDADIPLGLPWPYESCFLDYSSAFSGSLADRLNVPPLPLMRSMFPLVNGGCSTKRQLKLQFYLESSALGRLSVERFLCRLIDSTSQQFTKAISLGMCVNGSFQLRGIAGRKEFSSNAPWLQARSLCRGRAEFRFTRVQWHFLAGRPANDCSPLHCCRLARACNYIYLFNNVRIFVEVLLDGRGKGNVLYFSFKYARQFRDDRWSDK